MRLSCNISPYVLPARSPWPEAYEQNMNGLALKTIGTTTQASGIIGLINLTINLFRYKQVVRLNLL